MKNKVDRALMLLWGTIMCGALAAFIGVASAFKKDNDRPFSSFIHKDSIVFENTYRSVTVFIPTPDNRFVSQCGTGQTYVVSTRDTLLVKTPKAVFGFRPLYVDESRFTLFCMAAADTSFVSFTRITEAPSDNEATDGVLLYARSDGSAMAFYAKDSCLAVTENFIHFVKAESDKVTGKTDNLTLPIR